MDQQMIQALMGVFQQGLQILQQAQTGTAAPPGPMGGAPGADPSAAPGGAPATPPGAMGDDDDDDMYDDDQGNPGGMGDDAADDGMGSGSSLHDRVSQLENHTGLKKAARGTLSDRLDALESELLGIEYEGPMVERIAQLEKAAGIQPPMAKTAANELEESPAEIPLDALIKSAIQLGIQEGMAALAKAAGNDQGDDEIPDLNQMRKAARTGQYGQRRSQAPNRQSDADLVKAAAQYGWDADTLDEEVTLGDALLMQYHAQQGGEALPFDDDDD